jgi:hypothetical protein
MEHTMENADMHELAASIYFDAPEIVAHDLGASTVEFAA